MANHKSSEKRARQTITRTKVNVARKSRVKTAEKKLTKAIQAKDKAAAQELLKTLMSSVDRAAKHAVVSKQHAGRKKARYSAMVHQLTK